jgi:pyruvate,water dikinase
MRLGQVTLDNALRHLGDQWVNHDLPEIKAHLADWHNFNLEAAPMTELLAHLAMTLNHVKRLSEIHHRVQILAALAPSLFQDLYCDLFADGGCDSGKTFEAYRLLQGFDNKTLQASRSLWQLSRRMLAAPFVRQVLQRHSAADVMYSLEQSADGVEFLAGLNAYLDAYGQRSAKCIELDTPTWLEDPTPVIATLKDYVAQLDRDLEDELAEQAAERERAVAEARHRLQAYPQPVVDQFDFLLKAAQTGVFLSEDHNYWIDYCMTYSVRRVMLEFGRRFAKAGMIDGVDDVFYLTFDEVRSTASELPHLNRQQLVAGRRAEMIYFRDIEPPAGLGTVPIGPPPDDPLSRSDMRFWGAPPPPSTDPDLLHGHAGSPGTARGPARIVRSLAEASKVQQGDVLVAETTTPPWTPLFATAAAVVTDTGGVLSHCAIVAREYGIPAVVGAGNATTAIRDGQIVEVDGDTGVVRITR